MERAAFQVAIALMAGVTAGAASAQTPEIDVPTEVANALEDACVNITTESGQASCAGELVGRTRNLALRWSRAIDAELNDNPGDNLGMNGGAKRLHLGSIRNQCAPVFGEQTVAEVPANIDQCVITVGQGTASFPEATPYAEPILTKTEIAVIGLVSYCLANPEEFVRCDIQELSGGTGEILVGPLLPEPLQDL